ncbi:hypothetical protein Pmar_PMAR026284 [Perkinsus marinus ATCC 50983]|uniref:Uncharacterized protein n=1 Tax=Perkinsus marinus (strain ATCC 50983 / TXsc) TaxID=423536 RepID=C5LI73_PERM5|nr:hypothetical protein Pmar_PMAR026284 [Perkinsus marinus ATCC 50983]EER03608.1 hypothetical protein Pmar_PMAR026284 [Perkinsus marinus ATCC 50983]|eukprot:XP_002771792.1 hypothetical protein Pmar_PMAR026284 [Perkinsus marinus ATCC 50983]
MFPPLLTSSAEAIINGIIIDNDASEIAPPFLGKRPAFLWTPGIETCNSHAHGTMTVRYDKERPDTPDGCFLTTDERKSV